jgi:hypothetical protein
MARFRCRFCDEEGTVIYDGPRNCPNCGSGDVQFAIGEELNDDHPLVPAMKRLTKQHDGKIED